MSFVTDSELEMGQGILYRVGDATDPRVPGVKFIAHCVNDIGAWGAGFTRAISRRWPDVEEQYRDWKDRELGNVLLVNVAPLLWIANVVGQRGIRDYRFLPPIRYGALRMGLAKVRDLALDLTASVHMPRIGCGLAGGRWTKVEPIVTQELIDHGIPVTVYDLEERP